MPSPCRPCCCCSCCCSSGIHRLDRRLRVPAWRLVAPRRHRHRHASRRSITLGARPLPIRSRRRSCVSTGPAVACAGRPGSCFRPARCGPAMIPAILLAVLGCSLRHLRPGGWPAGGFDLRGGEILMHPRICLLVLVLHLAGAALAAPAAPQLRIAGDHHHPPARSFTIAVYLIAARPAGRRPPAPGAADHPGSDTGAPASGSPWCRWRIGN